MALIHIFTLGGRRRCSTTPSPVPIRIVSRLRDLGLANTGLQRLEVPERSDALFPALQAIVLDSNKIDEVS